MKTVTLKNILRIGLAGFVLCSTAIAQDPPNAEVNQDGDLVLDPGGAATVIEKPTGTVNQDGDLVLDSGTITKPTATVNQDGELELNDGSGTVLEVPKMPQMPIADFFTKWGNGPVYFSDIIRFFHNLGETNPSAEGWIFWEDWGVVEPTNGFFFINTRTDEESMWVYSLGLDSWAYFYVGQGGFIRLPNGTTFQGSVAFYLASPPAGVDKWHIFHSDETRALMGSQPTQAVEGTLGGPWTWTNLR